VRTKSVEPPPVDPNGASAADAHLRTKQERLGEIRERLRRFGVSLRVIRYF